MDFKIDLEQGDWFGYGGTKIGEPDSYAAAYRTYGPRKRTIAKATAIPTAGYVIRKAYQQLFRRPPEPKQPEAKRRRTIGPVQSGDLRGPKYHLSKMRRKSNYTGRRKRRRTRTIGRTRYAKRRRVVRRVVKRSKQPWVNTVMKNTKPVTYSYIAKGGIQGNIDKMLLFVPQFDAFNRVNSAALGTGAGYNNYTITTPTQWSSCVEESPQLLFAWAAYNSLNDSTEQRRTYLWGPRTYSWEFTNQELFPMQLKIHWVRPRRDIDLDAANLDADVTNWTMGSDMNDIIYRCLVRDRVLANPTVQGLFTSLNPTFSLFQSTSFCQLFKVVKTTSLKLDSGRCAVINHTINRGRHISDLSFADTNYVATRKTLIPIVTCVGCPVYEVNNVSRVAAGPPAITWIFKANWNWYTMNSNTQQYIITDLAAPGGSVIAGNARYVSKPAAVEVNAAP